VRLLVPAATTLDDPLTPYWEAPRQPVPGGCWVLANMVAGLDGTAAVRGRVGALSSPADIELFSRLRGVADVVLVGAETVRRERYGPVELADDLVARRREQHRLDPRVAVVSSSLQLDPELPLFTKADPARPPLVVTTAKSDVRALAGLPVEVIVAGEARVDLAIALSELAARSAAIVLCEGGPTLLGEMIASDLLDEYCLTVAPVVGGDPLPVVDTSGFTELSRFELAHVAEEDSSLFLRYVRGPRP
jgi:riboflavin biosynthesis pyrimidine reductase